MVKKIRYKLVFACALSGWVAPIFGGDQDRSVCDANRVGIVIENALGHVWNRGQVRAWDEAGEFWSMPLRAEIAKISSVLREKLTKDCDIEIADEGSYSVRVHRKTSAEWVRGGYGRQIIGPDGDLRKDVNLISSEGTTIGVFSPAQGEKMLILYSAKIAAAIARGHGEAKSRKFSEAFGKFSRDLDIEYNFGDVSVAVLGGVAKRSIRDVADLAFRDVRRAGYRVLPGSERSVSEFDGLFAPDRHESFWASSDGVLRVELTKIKHGQVRMVMNETKQLPR